MYKSTFRILFVMALLLALAAATYGFAASNTMPTATYAGDGSLAISGYTVSAIKYNLNATTPTTIDTVTFTTAPATTAGSTIKIQLKSAGGTWYSCTGAGTASISCTTTGEAVKTADQITIVIAD